MTITTFLHVLSYIYLTTLYNCYYTNLDFGYTLL